MVVSVLLYGCTTWILTKCMERKLNGICARMLRAVLNKSYRQQHSIEQQQYGHSTPISKAIQTRQARNVGHCWRSKSELINDVLRWTPSHGWARVGRPARNYLQQFCTDTGCSMEYLPKIMDDRDDWRERVGEICASGTLWWYIYIYIYNISPYLSKSILNSYNIFHL